MARIIPIDNLQLPQVQLFAAAGEPQLKHYFEPKGGLFMAESPKVIHRALDAGYVPYAMLCERSRLDTEEGRSILHRVGDIPIYAAEGAVIKGLTGYPLTGGFVLAMHRRALIPAAEVLKHARRIAVLEEVMNPTNIGAIFRSAAALGMDAVVLTPGASDPLYRRAIRVSMGTVFQIPWTYLSPTEEPLRELKDLGFVTCAMALKDDTLSIEDKRLKAAEKLAVVLGTEGEGLKDATIAACDYTVKIPMAHGVDSLNVAAASAVAFWQLTR